MLCAIFTHWMALRENKGEGGGNFCIQNKYLLFEINLQVLEEELERQKQQIADTQQQQQQHRAQPAQQQLDTRKLEVNLKSSLKKDLDDIVHEMEAQKRQFEVRCQEKNK